MSIIHPALADCPVVAAPPVPDELDEEEEDEEEDDEEEDEDEEGSDSDGYSE